MAQPLPCYAGHLSSCIHKARPIHTGAVTFTEAQTDTWALPALPRTPAWGLHHSHVPANTEGVWVQAWPLRPRGMRRWAGLPTAQVHEAHSPPRLHHSRQHTLLLPPFSCRGRMLYQVHTLQKHSDSTLLSSYRNGWVQLGTCCSPQSDLPTLGLPVPPWHHEQPAPGLVVAPIPS